MKQDAPGSSERVAFRGSSHPPTYVHCPLCGFEFEKRNSGCTPDCPLGKFCKLVRCPNCQYEFSDKPQLLTWFQRLFHRRKAPPPQREVLNLTELEEGEQMELVCVDGGHPSRRNALAVYGLVPGCQLVLQQKKPAFVIRVGETELAVEADIARDIFVKRISKFQQES